MSTPLKKAQIVLLAKALGMTVLILVSGDVLGQKRAIDFSYTAHQAFFKKLYLENGQGPKTNISQWSIPHALAVNFGSRGRVVFSAIRASSTYQIESEEKQEFVFEDWADVKINGSYRMGSGWLMTFGVSLPTGDESLSQRELVVASVISEDALDFPLTLYGSGYEGNLGLFRAAGVGKFTIGAGISYFARGPYQFLEANRNSKLRPGDEVTVTLGLSRRVRHGKMALNIYGTHRRTDTLEGSKIYDPGEKIVAKASLFLKRYPWSMTLEVLNRFRFGDAFISGGDSLNLVNDELSRNPYQLETRLHLEQALARNIVKISYRGEFKLFTENDAGNESAMTYGAGIGLQLLPAKWLVLGANLAYYVGHLTSLSQRFDIHGYRTSVTLRFLK